VAAQDEERRKLERDPREVEAAVYFSCLEALNNVAKYAEASSATVSLSKANGTLTLTVADGVGFEESGVAHGTGCRGSRTGSTRSAARFGCGARRGGAPR